MLFASLECLSQVNHDERTVTVEAGMELTDLNEQLYQNGLALSV